MTATIVVVGACSAGAAKIGRASPANERRLAACDGPATGLPDSLLRLAPRRGGPTNQDNVWADLARTTPGGFAGAYYDEQHHLIVRLAHPELAAEARVALRDRVSFTVERAEIQPARWDFAQLVDWFNYLWPRIPVAATADKDEVLNRVRFSVTSIEARDRIVHALAPLDLPCDLVVVDLNGLTVKL